MVLEEVVIAAVQVALKEEVEVEVMTIVGVDVGKEKKDKKEEKGRSQVETVLWKRQRLQLVGVQCQVQEQILLDI